MGKVKELYMTQLEKAEIAVETYYKQHKVEPLRAICDRLDARFDLAYSVLTEFNE